MWIIIFAMSLAQVRHATNNVVLDVMYVCQPNEIISNTPFLMWWEQHLIVTATH
jgi:hypothetical protein